MQKRKTSKKPTAPMTAWFPRIKRLTPRGFLSFAPEFPGVELGDLNVFVGANGSGKSNLFEAVRFLKEAQRDLRSYLTSANQVKDWIFEDVSTATVEILADVHGEWPRLTYTLAIEQTGTGDLRIANEGLSLEPHGLEGVLFERSNDHVDFGISGPPEPAVVSQTSLVSTRHPKDEPTVRLFREFLASLEFFSEWGFGRHLNPLKTPRSSANIQGWLVEDGTNAPLRFNTMLQRRGFRQKFLAHLSAVLPGVSDAIADFVMGSTQIVLLEENRSTRTPSSRLSDGSLHWIMLGLILLDEERVNPVFLDEPELGLHPDAILALAELIKLASTRRQVIVNTHSSLLVSAFTDQPECVYAFDRDEHGTRVDRVNPELIRSWKKRGEPLGEIWAAGAIGGNRW